MPGYNMILSLHCFNLGSYTLKSFEHPGDLLFSQRLKIPGRTSFPSPAISLCVASITQCYRGVTSFRSADSRAEDWFFLGREMRTARESCDLEGHSDETPKKEQNTCAEQACIFWNLPLPSTCMYKVSSY